MGRRSKEDFREGIRGRRVNGGAVGGSKLASLQDEAERLLAEHGMDAGEAPSPADEADAEAAMGGLVNPRGEPITSRAAPARADSDGDEAIVARAQRILRERQERSRASKQREPNGLLVITLEAQRLFEAQGYSPEVAARLTQAYSVIETGNVLSRLRDLMFPPATPTTRA